MSRLANYADRYRNLKFDRDVQGVLVVTLHSDGGPLLWSAGAKDTIHADLPDAFLDIARDPDNRVVVLTGAGDAFCAARDPRGYGKPTLAGYEDVYLEGRDILMNMMAIPVPVIAAVNGPVTIHPEMPALADIVLAADHAVFADSHIQAGLVPGDGCHVVWPMLLGPNRGRAFLLTGDEITAQEARALGVVHEVLPAEALMPRALEHARRLAGLTPMTLRGTRTALTHHIKQRLFSELDRGLLLEGFAYVDRAG